MLTNCGTCGNPFDTDEFYSCPACVIEGRSEANNRDGLLSGVAAGCDDYTPSELYWHEALDRSSLACDFFQENVEQHPAVQHDIELKAEAGKLTMAIADFYQKVGRKAHEFDQLKTES